MVVFSLSLSFSRSRDTVSARYNQSASASSKDAGNDLAEILCRCLSRRLCMPAENAICRISGMIERVARSKLLTLDRVMPESLSPLDNTTRETSCRNLVKNAQFLTFTDEERKSHTQRRKYSPLRLFEKSRRTLRSCVLGKDVAFSRNTFVLD